MTQKENFKRILDGKDPEFVPIYYDLYKPCGLIDSTLNHPSKSGMDAFGVEWLHTDEGSIPRPDKRLFDDITRWKEYVKFPNLDDFDFNAMAEADLKDANRDEKVVNVNFAVGLFQRLGAFMGFEQSLCAFIEEPEDCDEFFGAMADYSIACIEKMIDAYRPDVLTYFDDFAAAGSLFMSPDVFNEILLPHEKRIIKAIVNKGVVCAEHLCGKCENVLDDLVDAGISIWSAAQTQNDIPGIQKKFKGRLIVEGGWDSFGPAGSPDSSVEDVIKEADRCLKEYGQEDNYILFPIIVTPDRDDARIVALKEHWKKVSYKN